jgi:dTDP-4-dehydrorhamnose 3,5-epimerase-like enzyme
MIDFPVISDERGSLVAIESDISVPFHIMRLYYIFGTKGDYPRGFHAHKQLEQVLICVSGSCKVVLDNGKDRKEYLLDAPSRGVYVGPCMWREMYDFSKNSVLLVIASMHYDETDYIRNYDEYIRYVVDREGAKI